MLRVPDKWVEAMSTMTEPSPAADPIGPDLLTAFAAKFPEAAVWLARTSEGHRLVQQAAAAGVTFGGYIDQGPEGGLAHRAYSYGRVVYLPRHDDELLALGDFLFELTNASNAEQVAALNRQAIDGTLTVEQYAWTLMELELEAALRVARVWLQLQETLAGIDPTERSYGAYFFMPQYMALATGQMTRAAMLEDFLARRYSSGTLSGKTQRQVYEDLYRSLRCSAASSGDGT